MQKLVLPTTRYYGSKRKLISRIWNELKKLNLEFDSVLDVFGGSAMFSYYSKLNLKQVAYNDIFKFNYLIGKAIIENSSSILTDEDISFVLSKHINFTYDNVIERNFSGIYYNDSENRHIDVIVQNIEQFVDEYKRASAYYLLFQSCLIKRPFNLFHRKNLNLRTNYSGGNFGNKVTWERPFEELFFKFNKELSKFVFDNKRINLSHNFSALTCPINADLVYIDPPYFKNNNNITYHNKYHFLEGLCNYNVLQDNINFGKLNREIDINKSTEFESINNFSHDLDFLLQLHANSIIVLSYRNNGMPTIENLKLQILKYKDHVCVINLGQYGYALSRSNISNSEFLLVGM